MLQVSKKYRQGNEIKKELFRHPRGKYERKMTGLYIKCHLVGENTIINKTMFSLVAY